MGRNLQYNDISTVTTEITTVPTQQQDKNNIPIIVGVSIALVILCLVIVFAVINCRKIKEYFRPLALEPQAQLNPTQPNPVYTEITEGLRYLDRLNSTNHNNHQLRDNDMLDENAYVADVSSTSEYTQINTTQTYYDVNMLDEDKYVLDNSET